MTNLDFGFNQTDGTKDLKAGFFCIIRLDQTDDQIAYQVRANLSSANSELLLMHTNDWTTRHHQGYYKDVNFGQSDMSDASEEGNFIQLYGEGIIDVGFINVGLRKVDDASEFNINLFAAGFWGSMPLPVKLFMFVFFGLCALIIVKGCYTAITGKAQEASVVKNGEYQNMVQTTSIN